MCDSLTRLILFWESKAEGGWDFRHTYLVSFFLGVVFVAHCSVCCCFESHLEKHRRECRQLTRGCGLHFRSRCRRLQSQARQCWVSHSACILLRNAPLQFYTQKLYTERWHFSHLFHLLSSAGTRFTLNAFTLSMSAHSRLRQPRPVMGSIGRQAGRGQGRSVSDERLGQADALQECQIP